MEFQNPLTVARAHLGYHDTEDDGTENQRSDVFHLAANFSEDGISHEFCIKDDSDVGEGG